VSDLPTVGYRWRDKAGVNQASINDPQDNWCDDFSDMHEKAELVRRKDYRSKLMSHIEELLDQARKYDSNGFGAFASDCRQMAYYLWTHVLGEDRQDFSHEYADLLDDLTGAEWLKDIESKSSPKSDKGGTSE